MRLIHEKDNVKHSANFAVDGTADVWWDKGYEYDRETNRMIIRDERGLGIWTTLREFFRVRLQPGDDLHELARQVYEGTCTELAREYQKTDRPQPGETTVTNGNCPDCTMDLTQGLNKPKTC
jgi:hypothetical protein